MGRLSNLDRAIAIGHLQAGARQGQVAIMFGVSQATVSNLWRRFRDTGDVQDRARSGRPRVTTQQDDQYIRQSFLRNRRLTATEMQGRLLGRHGQRISDQTIRNRLHSAHLKARKAAQKPLLTVLHRRERLRWCREHRIWNQGRWGDIMFSDESRFCLRHVDGRRRVWRRRGERFADCCIQRKTPYGGGSIMIWAGISQRGKTRLVIVDGNLNGQRYINEILDPVAIPYIRNIAAQGILQDDNARPHRSRLVNDHLAAQGIRRLDWPSNSPDLNPIEHVWDQIGRAVYRRVTDATTLRDLPQFLREEWDALPQQRIQRLIASMRRRCQAVIDAYGGTTRY